MDPIAGLLGFGDMWRRPEPELRPAPEVVHGFRLRIDLQNTKPPVWRRIDVPGDIPLERLHEVVQAAMGWTDSHLHCFRTGNGPHPPTFLTAFDVSEGEEGIPEEGIRLDRVVSSEGDRLWYEYDFGDGWHHILKVEKVLDLPPETPICLAGRRACPPEDCGGPWGYGELADWVRADYADGLRPDVFDSTEEAMRWLPTGWHPDIFDVEQATEALAAAYAEPVAVVEELAALLDVEHSHGMRELHTVLSTPAVAGPTDVDVEAAAAATAAVRGLLDVIGEGVSLTAAGYLRPADVARVMERTGYSAWWHGRVGREDVTWPVADLRAVTRSLGLVSVRKGRLAPTLAAKRCADDPVKLLHHIARRLPLGKTPAERHAGWAALAVVGADTPAEQWESATSRILYALGWRGGRTGVGMPRGRSDTLAVLRILTGIEGDLRQLEGRQPTAAAVARSAIRPT